MSSKTEPVIDILMYHSISDAEGPTSIAPSVFRDQMQAIVDHGVPVITMDDFLEARAGRKELAPHSIIITFDDGFVDFADVAYPIMDRLGLEAIMYLPTGCLGGVENWAGCHTPPRAIMDWDQINDLAHAGVHFGSHTITHPDLNALKTIDLFDEVMQSKKTLEARLGRSVDHFAPPYGVADHLARTTIERIYKSSVGTVFERATLESDVVDLPRIEMFYYSNLKYWVDHLKGKGGPYMRRRKTMRQAREAMYRPWERA